MLGHWGGASSHLTCLQVTEETWFRVWPCPRDGFRGQENEVITATGFLGYTFCIQDEFWKPKGTDGQAGASRQCHSHSCSQESPQPTTGSPASPSNLEEEEVL